MANTIKEKELKTEWPITEGLTADTTKQTQVMNLMPEEKSFITERERKGID